MNLDWKNRTKVSEDTFVQWICLILSGSLVCAICREVAGGVNEQSDQELPMEFYMKQLTVEEERGGIVMSRKAQIAVYPVLEWFDDLGVYHDLTLFGSDVDWLSEMKVSIEDLRTRDRHKRQVSLGTRR